MNLKDELGNLKDDVEEILKNNEAARNDDKRLIIIMIEQIAVKMGKGIYIPEEVLEALPSFESITRARRLIQNEEGKYLSSKQKEQLRQTRAEEFRQTLGGKQI